ncbi:Acetyltransferase (GNAT) domain-containing protein [Streptomyces misionensis]|uniref:Acetyltransferase (GNAT) domain-containing protein n=1 Tax=Streptomyces misionensis TaxID=67331 RepID=A0A1H4XC93_9ACTN|nr:GNAT family N-acetyltransferase [Streptomyces misionensis]SED03362.1 Acetyltransferase (GNAT) domain-containing protein [Streptomyces misionensis]
MDYRRAVAADAPAMAELFAAHHHDALTERERETQGFVQGGLDADALRSMAEDGSLLVADDGGRLAGLLGLASPENLPSPPPPIRALLAAQDSLEWQGRPLRSTPFLLYGPVVVATDYRGQGVARGLFDTALQAASGRADVMVAFIELANRTSWKVHVDGFGMTPLGEFTIADRAYGVVGASTRPTTPDARR